MLHKMQLLPGEEGELGAEGGELGAGGGELGAEGGEMGAEEEEMGAEEGEMGAGEIGAQGGVQGEEEGEEGEKVMVMMELVHQGWALRKMIRVGCDQGVRFVVWVLASVHACKSIKDTLWLVIMAHCMMRICLSNLRHYATK